MSDHGSRHEVEAHGVSRRGVLGWAGGLLAAAGLGGLSTPRVVMAADASRPGLGKSRVARVVHMTDLHLQPERAAAEGVTACLAHVATQKPDLIVTGGDLIMDSFDASSERTRVQWDLFNKTFKDHAPCRVEHCLGNHDIWGWNKAKSKTSGQEPQWGKKWALDNLGLDGAYRAFDVGAGPGAWRVFVLDSVRPDGDGYIGHLDQPQREWLDRELEALSKQGDRNALVVSHIPILAACVLTGKWDGKATKRTLSGGIMHLDAGELHGAFRSARNVRLCLSGHIHQIDRIDMEGVSYICDGAVSGAWWKGANGTTNEGYGVVDLYADGTFEHVYVPFGWAAKP